ncbi:MAG: hypothetical protein IJ559_07935 [Prevotella sp.]|nr:hypothetical protein [Prevotella sp.]
MRHRLSTQILMAVASIIMMVGCTANGDTQQEEQPQDTTYTQKAAMLVYDYDPVRALQIIDSAVIVGNLSDWQADKNRARIYSQTRLRERLDSLMHWPVDARLDTARVIGERLLSHDSVKNSLEEQQNVLEILAMAARLKKDTVTWLQRSRQLVEVCRRQGAETEALRNEAEVGAALCRLGQKDKGMAMLDSVIVSLTSGEAPFKFNELDDLETALTRFAKATVDGWDETAEEDADEEGEPVYHDINVYRTADIDALGAEIKSFTDRLVSAYQTGGDDVRAKIDEVTANAYRVNEETPTYDLIDYAVNLTLALPDVFGSVWDSPLGQAFDRCIVYQQSSRWLQENDGTVDLSVLLGCDGHYTLDEGFMQMRFDADGTAYPIFYTGLSEEDAESWGSTLDDTYGQLRFDQLTGWSRWLRLNQQEPNPDCATGYNPFDRRKRK